KPLRLIDAAWRGAGNRAIRRKVATLTQTAKGDVRYFSYFLNRLLNAARASSALRGPGLAFVMTGAFAVGAIATPSLATVTRGRKSSQVFAWSFTAILTGM